MKYFDAFMDWITDMPMVIGVPIIFAAALAIGLAQDQSSRTGWSTTW